MAGDENLSIHYDHLPEGEFWKFGYDSSGFRKVLEPPQYCFGMPSKIGCCKRFIPSNIRESSGVSDCVETPRSYVANFLPERLKQPSIYGGYRFLIIRYAFQHTFQKPSKTFML
jgi:hypothetical protein